MLATAHSFWDPNAMKKVNVSVFAMVVMCLGGYVSAEEFTLEQAVAAWSFAEGDWTVTAPSGEVASDSAIIRVAPSKVALVSQSKSMLHVLGWIPPKRSCSRCRRTLPMVRESKPI